MKRKLHTAAAFGFLALSVFCFNALSAFVQPVMAQCFGDSWPNLRCFYHKTEYSPKATAEMIFKAESEMRQLPKKKRGPFMLERMQEIVNLEPDNGSLYLILSGLQEQQGNKKEAEEAFAQFEKLSPGKGGVKSLRMFLRREFGEAFDKQREVDDATWMNPREHIFDEDDFLYRKPASLFPDKLKPGAKKNSTRADDFDVDPRTMEVFRGRDKLISDHKFAEALAIFEKYLLQATAPDAVLYLKNCIGDSQLRLGRLKEGEKTLLEVVGAKRTSSTSEHIAVAYQLLANTYYRQKRLADCKQAIEKCLEIKDHDRYVRTKAFADYAIGVIAND